MASLKAAEKRWIVEQLACFDTPQEVAEAFPAAFPGRAVTRQQAANFDASKVWARTRMAADLVALFDDTRTRFREETDDIAIANKAWRLRRLQRIHNETKSPALKLQVLEQAAKESGDAYTNRHVLQGDPKRPLQVEQLVRVYLPDNGRGDGPASPPSAPPAAGAAGGADG